MDGVICVLMILGFIHGFIKGAIQEIFAALALVIGVIVAGKASAGLESVTSQLAHATIGKVFVFALTFLVVAIVIGLVGRMFSGLAKAANLRMIDRLIGGVVGACLVGIAMGIILSIALRLGGDILAFEDSALAEQLILAVKVLAGFLPKASEVVETALLYM
jgi:membrane protein required for colicin V production